MKLTKTIGKEILLGSWFLGGGGGGLPEGGEAVLEQVLQTGEVVFRDVAELADDEFSGGFACQHHFLHQGRTLPPGL